jgi:hypothetical protein
VASLCTGTLLATPASPSPEVPIEMLAFGGQQAPGAPDGVRFSAFASAGPVIGRGGDVAFWARVTGTGVSSTNDSGMWLARASGELVLVAREGAGAPGIPGASLGELATLPAIDASGRVAFSDGSAVWIADPAGHALLVARRGAPAPGALAGVRFSSTAALPDSDRMVLNDAGELAFAAQLEGTGIDPRYPLALFGPGPSGEPTLRAGALIPIPGGNPLDFFISYGDFDLNDGREIAFAATWIRLGQVTKHLGTFRLDLQGAVSPLPDGLSVTSLPPTLSRNGDIAYIASTAGNAAVWLSHRSGEATAIFAEGRHTLHGVDEIDRLRWTWLNDSGRIVFRASARRNEGSWHSGIFRSEGPGNVETIVLADLQAPGLAPGIYVSRGGYPEFYPPLLNQRGDLLIRGFISGQGHSGDDAIFFSPAGGKVFCLAAAGESLEVEGELRTATALFGAFSGRSRRALDDDGRVAFGATFSDGVRAILRASVPVFDDRDGDGVEDLADDCPDVSSPKGDRDGDGLGDACDPYPMDADPEKGQLRLDLAQTLELIEARELELETAQSTLAQCLERPVFSDADGDGEDDATDACAATHPGDAVDDAGCSAAQFCARFEATTPEQQLNCRRADWLGDEPSRPLPDDCAVVRDPSHRRDGPSSRRDAPLKCSSLLDPSRT